MSKRQTIIKTDWVCDVCDKEESSDHHGLPDKWSDIVIAFQGDRNKENIDWRSHWRGHVCYDCYSAGKKYPSIGSTNTAKPLIKKIFGKMLKRSDDGG